MAPILEPPPPADAPAPRFKFSPGFVVVTPEQLAIPETPRGAVPDDHHLSIIEKYVLCAILRWNHSGKPCTASNLEIADAIGLRGDPEARRMRVQIALNGRWLHGVKVPGMADP